MTRADIALLMGITHKRLNDLVFKNKIKLPQAMMRKRSTFIYDAQDVDVFLKSSPLNFTKQTTQKPISAGLDNNMAFEFLKGTKK